MNIFTVLMPWFDQIYAKCLLKKTKKPNKNKRSKVMSVVKKWSVPLEVSESYSSVTQLWNMDVNMDMELNINVHSIQYAVCAFVESSGLCYWQTNDPFPVKLSFLSAGGTDLIWLIVERTQQWESQCIDAFYSLVGGKCFKKVSGICVKIALIICVKTLPKNKVAASD